MTIEGFNMTEISQHKEQRTYQRKAVEDAYADSGGHDKNGKEWASYQSALASADYVDGTHDGTLTEEEVKSLEGDFDQLTKDLQELQNIKSQNGTDSEQFKTKKQEVDKQANEFQQKVHIERSDTENIQARQSEEESKQFAIEKNKALEDTTGIKVNDTFLT